MSRESTVDFKVMFHKSDLPLLISHTHKFRRVSDITLLSAGINIFIAPLQVRFPRSMTETRYPTPEHRSVLWISPPGGRFEICCWLMGCRGSRLRTALTHDGKLVVALSLGGLW